MPPLVDLKSVPPQPADNALHIAAQWKLSVCRLVDGIRSVKRSLRERVSTPGAVRRVEVPLTETDPLSWLAAMPSATRYYWASRDTSFEVAAWGSACDFAIDTVNARASVFESMQQLLATAEPDVCLYGGTRFDIQKQPDLDWDEFGLGKFFLPRFELMRRDAKHVLACNLLPAQDAQQLDAIEVQAGQLSPPARLAHQHRFGSSSCARALKRTDHPDAAEWCQQTGRLLERIRCGEADKVVLARSSVLQSDNRLSPFEVLDALRDHGYRGFRFVYQPNTDAPFFVGASPERLYQRDGDTIITEAVAGTRPRGVTLMGDDMLRAELEGNDKERREHQCVVDALLHALRPLTLALHDDVASHVVTLQHAHHLCTTLRGQLRPNVTDATLIDALHPTPAVGGWPRRAALRIIAETETFDRGWYAGPIGYLSQRRAEFAVGIRSALIDANRLKIFAGAGIVSGSKPDREWDEVETKAQTLMTVLPGPTEPC